MKPATLLLALLCASCAHIDMQPTPGWPKLDTVTVRLPDGEVYGRCIQSVPVWRRLMLDLPIDCAEWNLYFKTRVIYAGESSPQRTIWQTYKRKPATSDATDNTR